MAGPEAGIHMSLKSLDSRLRGNDGEKRKWTFYESINFDFTLRKVFFGIR